MSDIYFGDYTISDDLSISDSARLHLDGLDLQMQTLVGDVWTAHQTWSGNYDGVWRLHYENGKAHLQEQNGSNWVTATIWG
jgi:hypothetical protein